MYQLHITSSLFKHTLLGSGPIYVCIVLDIYIYIFSCIFLGCFFSCFLWEVVVFFGRLLCNPTDVRCWCSKLEYVVWLQDAGGMLASDQVQFSLLYRKHEKDGLLAKAKQLGVSVIAYSPLAQGMLTGSSSSCIFFFVCLCPANHECCTVIRQVGRQVERQIQLRVWSTWASCDLLSMMAITGTAGHSLSWPKAAEVPSFHLLFQYTLTLW